MDYREALRYIHSIEWRGSKPGLSRTRDLLHRLGDPHRRMKFVHVAGTNGKGSVCEMISSVLRECGYKVGMDTSPYIFRFNERIQSDGREIPDDVLAKLTEEIRPHAEAMEDPPTEFELITALGFLYFEREQCDLSVIEVGLGGELDSTNVIESPEAVVIATIGLDHMAYLGSTYREIAQAKAGIIKEGCDVAFYGKNAEAEAVIRQVCEEKHARLLMADHAGIADARHENGGIRFSAGERKDLFINLRGDYQPENAALALTALDILKERGWRITDDAVRRGLANARWPGRFELLRDDPPFVLDGGHNPEGVQATVESLKKWYPGKKIHFLVGVMGDKDIASMLAATKELAADYVAVRPDNPRAMAADILAEKIRQMGKEAKAFETVAQGVKEVKRRCGREEIGCAVGSLYMAAAIKREFR